jgi:hypothetical protein
MAAEDGHPVNLDDAAVGVAQLNTDLQRSTDAYRYFTNTLLSLRKVQVGEQLKAGERLPYISFKFATTSNAGVPGEYKLDIGALPKDDQIAMLPVFESLCSSCAEDLLVAWERLVVLVNEARLIVQEARSDVAPGE